MSMAQGSQTTVTSCIGKHGVALATWTRSARLEPRLYVQPSRLISSDLPGAIKKEQVGIIITAQATSETGGLQSIRNTSPSSIIVASHPSESLP